MRRSPVIGISTGFSDYGDYLGVAFSRPLEQRGALPVVLPYLTEPTRSLVAVDAIVLAVGRDLEPSRFGGATHPAATAHSPLRDVAELGLCRAALRASVPVLGICRGMQIINVALGGTLHADHSVLPEPANRHPGGDWQRWEAVVEARLQDRPSPPHPSHRIEIADDSLLGRALGSHARVNSYHHQSIATLGAGLRATAVAPDGVIEAVELPGAGAMCLGVQWELQEEPDSPVFDLLLSAAHAHVGQRRAAA